MLLLTSDCMIKKEGNHYLHLCRCMQNSIHSANILLAKWVSAGQIVRSKREKVIDLELTFFLEVSVRSQT